MRANAHLKQLWCKVLHPRAALAAARYKFDMKILSSFEDNPGTLISSKILIGGIIIWKKINYCNNFKQKYYTD